VEEYREKYIQIISETIENNIRNSFKCVLMSFCEIEGDLQICKEIAASLSEEVQNKVDIINYDGNIEMMLNIIAESKLIIASRFHVNIFGILCNTKILPLVYNDKTSNVSKEIGFDDEIVKIEQCEKI